MIKISKMTDYAVIVLVALGRENGALLSSSGIVSLTGLPDPTVAKVLKSLARGGLIESVRGVRGGYRLERPVREITVACVVEAMDGPIILTSCVERSASCCEHAGGCPMKGRWDPVNIAMRTALSEVTLADMIG